eukprot:scaffold3916_cov18-Tisochrysis_lutea.AAC.1
MHAVPLPASIPHPKHQTNPWQPRCQADTVFSNPEQDIKEAYPDKEAQDVEQLVKLAARNLQAVKDSAGNDHLLVRGCDEGVMRVDA